MVGRRPPVDDPVLASSVSERVLVLPGGEVRSERCEALLDVTALRGVDEDVPVQQPDDLVLVRVARDVECSVIDALDAPVRADDREHARHGVRDRVEERDLGAQLRLEPVAAKRQAGCRSHRVEQLGLVVERGVVRDRGDPPAIPLDELHRSACGRSRLRRGMPLKVDPATTRRALTLVEPVDDGETLVLQGARERVSERRSVLQRNDQFRDGDAAQARSAAIMSPESSPLGTKPHAQEPSTSSP